MNDPLREYTELISLSKNLEPDQVNVVASQLISESISPESKMRFLKELSSKGETDDEFSSFVSAFRGFAKDPLLSEFSSQAIDLCGTGGDQSGSFNISTFVSIVVATAGVPVIKHGNRSISSKCGSADILEALGIPMEVDPEKLSSSLNELNFCFLFAPHFHPAFKNLAPVRQALAKQGIITLFNRLGPCLNPATPAHQILGVYDPKFLKQMAHCLLANGSKSGWVVHGMLDQNPAGRMDELTACGTNIVCSYGDIDDGSSLRLDPEHWGMKTYPAEHIKGGGLKENLSILDQLLNGNAPTGLKATVLMNASSALRVAGHVQSLKDGVSCAEELLASGAVTDWLSKAQKFFSRL